MLFYTQRTHAYQKVSVNVAENRHAKQNQEQGQNESQTRTCGRLIVKNELLSEYLENWGMGVNTIRSKKNPTSSSALHSRVPAIGLARHRVRSPTHHRCLLG